MRLIDADALPVHKAYCVDEAGWGANFYVVDKSDIDAAPTIEAEPVKHGRWLPHPTDREWDVCSVCGIGTKRREYGKNPNGTEWETEYGYIRCPNCGAKMEVDNG